MMKNCLLAIAVIVAAPGSAHAGGQAGAIGVGAEYQLSGIGGASLSYDAGNFHVGGFLGIDDPPRPSNTSFEIGARGFFHMHKTAMSDFGLGGSFGLASIPDTMGGMPNRLTAVFLEPSFQIRLFLAANVALS